MVKNLSYTPGQLNAKYVDLMLPHCNFRQRSLIAPLRAFLLKGGPLASHATKSAPRDSLFRAAHRFSKLHQDVLDAVQYLDVEDA